MSEQTTKSDAERAGVTAKGTLRLGVNGWEIVDPALVTTEGREEPEVCICAAVRSPEGRIIRGNRHHDCLRAASEIAKADASLSSAWPRYEQGFVTSRNRYVDRAEGYRLQVAAGIESQAPGGYRGEQLFSEDLYR